MKVFAISDLHLSFSNPKPMDIFGSSWEGYWEKITADWTKKVSDDDIVIIAGDISWAMNIEDAKIDFAEISKLKGTKVIIRGNHDYWWSSYNKVKNMIGPEYIAIQNNAIRKYNIIFCGSRGWTPNGNDSDDAKIYNRELLRMRLSLDQMKAMRQDGDKVIVLTHYPPFNVDLSNNDMTNLILEYSPDAVIYGHLHGKDCRAERLVTKENTKFYLTSCDLIDNTLVEIMDLDISSTIKTR